MSMHDPERNSAMNRRWGRYGLAGVGCALLTLTVVAAGDIGYIESFALAKDRAESLKQLIPGTEDYYYYHALHLLQMEQYPQAQAMTGPWHQRYGQTPRLTEIQLRHALLTYDRDPQQSLDFLKRHLGLHFNHEREVIGASPNLPTTLNPKLIGWDTLKAHSLTAWSNLDNFDDLALERLAGENLSWERRRNLLQRLTRPDVPNLARLVLDDLQAPQPQTFGAYPIHRQMALAQLEDLLKLRPELLNEQAFVYSWLVKLHPSTEEDWRNVPALTQAYLEKLWAFVSRLSPAFNSLRSNVLYHWLAFDRAHGRYDRERFLEYLKLPRSQPYMAKGLLESDLARTAPADLNADVSAVTLFVPIHTDEPLVRSYLRHFFVEASSPREFEPYINDVYLRHLFAETKVENGLGDPEQWSTWLPPEQFRQFKERVDIDFAFTNPPHFAADEAVRLDVHLKNTPTLLVKVFEINTTNFYREQQREVNTDINLDGLVANEELTVQLNESPLRRVTRRLELPRLTKPGVYVIDLIGNGKSSRALVRKGRLRPIVDTGTAGLRVTVVDEANRQVKDAILWLDGQEYTAGKDGTIIVPFSTQPGRKPIILSRGNLSSLDYLEHPAENIELRAGIYVERESLLLQKVAPVLVRPGLYINGQPVSLKLLENVKLRISSRDLDGIVTTTEVPEFKVFPDRESTYDFRVPARLVHLEFTLTAQVKNLSQNKTIDVQASQSFSLNTIDQTDRIEDLHLARFGEDYVLELLGRTGEPRPDRPVRLSLMNQYFRQPVQVTLKSDVRGRVHLGSLADINSVTATGPENTSHAWTLPLDHHTYRDLLHAKAGEVITLPYLGSQREPTRGELALFELRAGTVRADRFDALSIKDGLLEIHGLSPGDYDLWLKTERERVRIRVADGPVIDGYILGATRYLEMPALKPVQVGAIETAGDSLTIRLQNASPLTRVHVLATRYLPQYSAFDQFRQVTDAELRGITPGRSESVYLTGRNIGDEYRYVLDRKGMKKFAGNMLERPQLLLNPWAVRTTETGEQLAAQGEAFAPRSEPAPGAPIPSPKSGEGSGAGKGKAGEYLSDLDYLADPAIVIPNLVPDKDGVITVSKKDLGPHALIRVVALDPWGTTVRAVSLPEQPAAFRDLRLKHGLDPKAHFTQQKQVTVLQAGQPFVLDDITASRFEAYDSLARVYGFYRTLSGDPKLTEFGFVVNWPNLKPEEKRANYSKYACHELNFFLFQKDPEFFRTVIKPYLANKKDKTFLDHWLIGDDLKEYLDPWPYGRLNMVERALLAQRLADETARTRRHFQDLMRLQPPALDRQMTLFDTALKASALEGRDVLGLEKAKHAEVLRRNFARGAISRDEFEKGAAADGGRYFGAPGRSVGKPAGAAGDKKSAQRLGEREAKSESKELESALKDMAGKNRLLDDRAENQPRQLYRRLDPTQEWAENNYYHLPITAQVASLVGIDPFWVDYAQHDGKTPFFSRHFVSASHNFTEMMFGLAVLDLPFAAGKHEVKFDAGKMTLTPASPVIAFHEEVRPTGEAKKKLPILVSQNVYRVGDRFRVEGGEKIDHFITDEFLVQTAYGCQVVVTNPTSSRQKLTVLLQLPVGAIPLANAQYTRTVLLDLEPYRTQTIDYLFYFPKPGSFAHFPVNVAKNEQFVVAGSPFTFNVVVKATKVDTESWDYVSQHGTSEQVLALLNRENVQALNLDKIAFRMKDRAFFEAVTKLLRLRHSFSTTLWSYALFHNAVPEMQEYLRHADQLVAQLGNGPLVSTPLTIDPVARHLYEYLEYKPLVNARAHALGHARQIVNDRFLQQYQHFLKMLSYKRQLDDADLLAVTYYLLLQDRIEEALETFGRVNPGRIATTMQYDYCAAYLAFFGDEPARARAIAAKYADHPVDRWRNTFRAVLGQLDEIEGKAGQIVDKDDRNQRQGQLAAGEPSFDFTLDARAINLTWQNISAVRVNYYLMDVELLFSRNPFVQQYGSQFASIRPNQTQEVKLPEGQTKQAVPLPADLANRNVLVEITAAGKTRALPYYANALDVKLQENYGQLRVADAGSGKGLPKVYVKVYARLADGQVKFHKDGYTDHRGKFDYASVSTPERSPIRRFAVLVLSEDKGAVIREAAPPAQ